jgi:hypothetical protein
VQCFKRLEEDDGVMSLFSLHKNWLVMKSIMQGIPDATFENVTQLRLGAKMT